ncbi:O-sialoglycoprotein endopeptidase [Effusibacillus dendaii]|uniref:N(6)-L-threonylcarbamoyladenine synthase n=2 Tax=Effusibacillus dendaii TaxID=2743772 RepID=A0A7I8DAR6_9BACL|nr:O-sialoglycoprotein endopeptidase [Effusibacillus dendaii]
MILGIDTSNYTTSLCLVNANGAIVREERQLLQVDRGARGLQQSEALFQHVKNLPLLMEKIGNLRELQAVCVSTRPRPAEGSYMPVFLAGEGLAKSISAALQIPFYETSHQEGHIAAGEATVFDGAAGEATDSSGSAPLADSPEFLAIHLSGGTSDLLRVKRHPVGYQIEPMGSSVDLHAGQFVDRIGVALGLPFPAGPHLEKLASFAHENSSVRLPSPVIERFNWSFAGPETAADRLIAAGADKAAVARAVEACIAKGLEKVIRNAMEETNLQNVLIVGGVAANLYIRKRLQRRLEHPAVKARLFFAEPRYSTDNAFGVARIGLSIRQTLLSNR